MEKLSAPLPGTGKAPDPVHHLINISLVCIFLMVCFTADTRKKKVCLLCDFIPLSFYHLKAKKIHVEK